MFKLHVSDRYASVDHLIRTEEKLIAAIDKLATKIDRMLESKN